MGTLLNAQTELLATILTTEAMGSQKDSLVPCNNNVSEKKGTSATREGNFLAVHLGDRGPGRSKVCGDPTVWKWQRRGLAQRLSLSPLPTWPPWKDTRQWTRCPANTHFLHARAWLPEGDAFLAVACLSYTMLLSN